MKKEELALMDYKNETGNSLSGYYASLAFNSKRFGLDEGFVYFYGRIVKSM
jgi:hypothetical protein